VSLEGQGFLACGCVQTLSVLSSLPLRSPVVGTVGDAPDGAAVSLEGQGFLAVAASQTLIVLSPAAARDALAVWTEGDARDAGAWPLRVSSSEWQRDHQ